MIRSSLLVVAVLFTLSSVALAAPPGPVRCRGRIQFKACAVPSPQQISATRRLPVVSRSAAPPRVASRPPTNLFARVAKTSFQRIGARDGLWRGVVSGNGLVHLQLLIRRAGSTEQRWRIGSIHLNNGKSTNFGFRTVVPPGDHWTWQVVATATHNRKI